MNRPSRLSPKAQQPSDTYRSHRSTQPPLQVLQLQTQIEKQELLNALSSGLHHIEIMTPEDPEQDDSATHIAANLLKKLWRPVINPHPFRTLESWTLALPNYQGDTIPRRLLDKAKILRAELLPTDEAVLLPHLNVSTSGDNSVLDTLGCDLSPHAMFIAGTCLTGVGTINRLVAS